MLPTTNDDIIIVLALHQLPNKSRNPIGAAPFCLFAFSLLPVNTLLQKGKAESELHLTLFSFALKQACHDV